MTNTFVSVGTNSTEVLPASGSRQHIILTNDSDSVIYVSFGAAAELNKGIRLNPAGGVVEINTSALLCEPIYAISLGENKNLCVTYK